MKNNTTKSLACLAFVIFLLNIGNGAVANSNQAVFLIKNDSIPAALKGSFKDDYGIEYRITDSIWTQLPDVNYHIIEWNTTDHYILAKNDLKNPSEPGLFTRIDYMTFKDMAPYEWGFCLKVYNAQSKELALAAIRADSKNPRKGCNGFPYSRMKR